MVCARAARPVCHPPPPPPACVTTTLCTCMTCGGACAHVHPHSTISSGLHLTEVELAARLGATSGSVKGGGAAAAPAGASRAKSGSVTTKRGSVDSMNSVDVAGASNAPPQPVCISVASPSEAKGASLLGQPGPAQRVARPARRLSTLGKQGTAKLRLAFVRSALSALSLQVDYNMLVGCMVTSCCVVCHCCSCWC
jgi:hypothetical protein